MSYRHAHHSRFPIHASNPDYLEVTPQDARLMRQAPLHLQVVGGGFVRFKASGQTLDELGIAPQDQPRRLYLHRQDHEAAVSDIQRAMLDGMFRDMVKQGDQATIKQAFTSLVEEAFLEPRLSTLMGFQGMVETFVEEYSLAPHLLRAFLLVASEGYDLTEHSVNVMALVAGCALRMGHAKPRVVDYCLAGLLHDVGKTKLDEHLRMPARSLRQHEFSRYKLHPLEGQKILRQGAGIPQPVLDAAAQHHERLDGSGYPKGIREVSEAGQVVGLADSYELLTRNNSGGRKHLPPLESLSLLKKEADEQKFSLDVFRHFAHSLAS